MNYWKKLSDRYGKIIFDALEALGDLDFIKFEPPPKGRAEDGLPYLDLITPRHLRLTEEHYRFKRWVGSLTSGEEGQGYRTLVEYQVYQKLFQEGEHVIRPSLETVQFLDKMDCNVSASEFHQPFTTTIVEFDERTKRWLGERIKWKIADYCMVYQNKTNDLVVALTPSCIDRSTLVGCLGGTQMREEALMETYRIGNQDNDATRELDETLTLLMPILLNLMLLATGQLHRVPIKKRKRDLVKSKRKPRVKLLQPPNYYTIQQEGEIHLKVNEWKSRIKEAEKKGRTVTPHWRRGHWRRQAHGPRMSLRRWKKIEPVLVLREKFKGQKKDSQTTFRGKKKEELDQ